MHAERGGLGRLHLVKRNHYIRHEMAVYIMSLVMRKPVFGVSSQVRLKLVCTAIEASWNLEILDIETRDTILSRQ